jgi:hypothetical protein
MQAAKKKRKCVFSSSFPLVVGCSLLSRVTSEEGRLLGRWNHPQLSRHAKEPKRSEQKNLVHIQANCVHRVDVGVEQNWVAPCLDRPNRAPQQALSRVGCIHRDAVRDVFFFFVVVIVVV